MQNTERDQLIEDLENIFKQSMTSGKLSTALKAKELLVRIKGLLPGNSSSIKPLSAWTNEEIEDFIFQLDRWRELKD